MRENILLKELKELNERRQRLSKRILMNPDQSGDEQFELDDVKTRIELKVREVEQA
jgi:predicted  nucleic acid-binding Zn-ribbon protein